MTQFQECAVGEDGTLNVNDTIESIAYHSGLNVVLVNCKSKQLKILDLSSGVILRDSQLTGWFYDLEVKS